MLGKCMVGVGYAKNMGWSGTYQKDFGVVLYPDLLTLSQHVLLNPSFKSINLCGK